jgi:hypothetical protein
MSIGLWEARNTFAIYCMWIEKEMSTEQFLAMMHELYFEEYERMRESEGAEDTSGLRHG